MAKLHLAHAWHTQAAWAKKRLNDGNNNGKNTHGARKHAWRTQAAWAKKIVDDQSRIQPK